MSFVFISSYSEKVLGDKGIKDINVIKLDDMYQKQIERLNELAKGEPINLIAALIPRARVWKWLEEENKVL